MVIGSVDLVFYFLTGDGHSPIVTNLVTWNQTGQLHALLNYLEKAMESLLLAHLPLAR
jgi:hypothetical protein